MAMDIKPSNADDPQPRSYYRPGDHWHCGRIQSLNRCEQGPSVSGRCTTHECHPRRNVQQYRRLARTIIATFGFGLLLWILCGPYNSEILAPGPLTKAHSQILGPAQTTSRCAACHAIGRYTPIGWFSSILPSSDPGHSQGALCQSCHVHDLPSLVLNTPHDLETSELKNLTQSLLGSTNKSAGHPPYTWESQKLACSHCHREHHGREADLQFISSQKCQACHQSQFASFAHGHPEFSNYPYDRERRIAFNHARHQSNHFVKQNASFDCKTCHVQQNQTGVVGSVFRSVSFERGCSKCHDASIRASMSEAIVFLQLPSLDVNAIKKAGESFGSWPEAASQISEGTVPTFMQILLAFDSEGRSVLEGLPAGTKLSDLDFSNSRDRTTALQLAKETKRLLREIANRGQQAVIDRITPQMPDTPPETWIPLMAGMPPDLFRQAYSEWFSPLSQEQALTSHSVSPTNLSSKAVSSKTQNASSSLLEESDSLLDPGFDALRSDHNSQSPPLDTEEELTQKPFKPAQHLINGGWMIDRNRMAIVYVPQGHADPMLAGWTELANRIRSSKTMDLEPSSSPLNPFWGAGLLQPSHSGRCVECHLLTQTSTTSESNRRSTPLNLDRFRTIHRPTKIRQMTRFDHSPHIILPSLNDCTACHRIVPNSSLTNHQPEFELMKTDDCKSCHLPNAAGDQCTQCHNYHVGEEGWMWDHPKQSMSTISPEIAELKNSAQGAKR